MKRKTTLSFKMTLVFGLSIAVAASSFNILWFSNTKRNIEDQAVLNISNNSLYSARNLEMLIDNLKSFSFSVVSNPSIISELNQIDNKDYEDDFEGVNKIEKLITPMLFSQKSVSAIHIMGKNGTMYQGCKTFFYSDYYKDTIRKELQRYIDDREETKLYFLDNKNTENKIPSTISLIRTIRDPESGKTLGYTKVDIEYKLIHDLLSGVFKNPDDFYVVTQSDKEFFSSEHKEEVDLSGQGTKKMMFSGTEYVKCVSELDASDLKLIYFINNKEQAIRISNLITYNLFILAMLIFISFLFSYIISKIITKNIRIIREAMFRVADGDLDVNVDIKTDDEMKILGNSFNNMVLCLKELYERVFVLEVETKAASFRALQAQINPHFFFNTMECISFFAVSNENKKILDIIDALTKNFRYALGSSKTALLHQEIEHTKAYVTILSMRYPDKINLKLDIDESLHHIELPKLTIQPLVENSILHGILKKREAKNIIIKVKSLEQSKILISVYDDGCGIHSERLEDINKKINTVTEEVDEHIGLYNTVSRLKLLFSGKVNFNISSVENEFTEVNIIIRYSMEAG